MVSCRSKVSQAGDGGGRAIQAACVSILFENPCEKVQGVVVCFLQHIKGEGGGCVSPQECVAALKQEAAGVCFCLGQ